MGVFRNMKLAVRLGLVVTLVLLVGFFTLWKIVDMKSVSMVNEQIGNQMTDAVESRAAIINDYVESAEEYLEAFAKSDEPFDHAGVKVSASGVKRINAIMQTSGFYDEAGEFSFLVGLPGKSGVGGGIVAVYPSRYSIAVWSPRLNKHGNSIMGIKALERFTTETSESIF